MRRCRARLPAALHVTDADTKSGGRRIVRGLPTRTEPAQLRPDTVAHLVCFTILTRARSGRTKTTQVRLLTTLLDPDLYPAAELASRADAQLLVPGLRDPQRHPPWRAQRAA